LSQLFLTETGEPEDFFSGQFLLYRQWVEQEDALQACEQLSRDISWQQEAIRIAGKQIMVPRLVCWMGDDKAQYQYSGVVHHPDPWYPLVQQLKIKIEEQLSQSFNSCLLNFYRDEYDSVSWHSDDEPELGEKPVIASLSLGAERLFQIKHKQSKKRYDMPLGNGDLLIMQKQSQQDWSHCIPKLKYGCGPRINLTFRTIKNN